jgi:hypothetical protein
VAIWCNEGSIGF